ncbi:MAG: hypothetical protein KA318_00220 [Nitrosomonas sp.]|nr:hypothetical protein [Nitrosomonas sp.]
MARKAKEPLKIKKEGKSFGRPELYTKELGELVCEKVATHSWGLEKICNHFKELPSDKTVTSWFIKHDDFFRLYMDAKKAQTHLIAEEIKNNAADAENYIYTDPITGAKKIDSGIVAMKNLQVKTLQWSIARLNPKHYGDKQVIETTNTDNDEIKKSLTDIRDKLSEKSKREY